MELRGLGDLGLARSLRIMSSAILILLGLTVLRFVLAALLPVTPDEAYYFTWAQHLQAGYYDHPPMVALWIRLGTALLGPSPLGIRFLGPVSAAIGSWFMYDAGNRLFAGQSFGLRAAALFNATLMLGAGCLLMTPDTPLIFFWTLGLWALARLVQSDNPRWWLVAGGCAGLMLFSKYTGALFLAGAGLWALTCPQIRRHLQTIWPWAGGLLAGLIFLPDIIWNADHGWVSYLKQGGRVSGFDPARALQFFGELVGGQFMLFTPLIALFVVCGLWRLRGNKVPGARLLLWLTLLPAVVFLEHVLTNRVESNWPAILYPSACLAGATLSSRWLRPALLVGFGLTALVYLQAATGVVPIPAKQDTTALQMAGWQNLVQEAVATHPAFITSDTYTVASELALYAPKDVPVVGFSGRWAYFNWPTTQVAGQKGLLLIRQDRGSCQDQIAMLPRRRGNQVIELYRLCVITAPSAGQVFPRG